MQPRPEAHILVMACDSPRETVTNSPVISTFITLFILR